MMFNKIKIVETKYVDEAIYQVAEITEIDRTNFVCRDCNTFNYIGKGKTRLFKYYDLPIDNKKTFLTLKRKLFLCKECGAYFVDNTPDLHNKVMTKRFYSAVIDAIESNIYNNSELARMFFMNEKSIRRFKKTLSE